MNEHPIVQCGACDQILGADPRDLESLMEHDQSCPAQPYWGRGFRAGQREALTDVRLHGNPDAPERVILLDLISELRTEHTKGIFNPICNCCVDDWMGETAMSSAWPRESLKAAERAEARMQALQTPGGSAGADLKKGKGSDDE